MRFIPGRVIFYYFLFSTLAIISLFSTGIYRFIDSGGVDSHYIDGLYNSSFKIERLKESGEMNDFIKLVESDRIKDANLAFNKLTKSINEFSKLGSDDLRKKVDNHIKYTKTFLSQEEASVDISTLLNTITFKLSGFEHLVTENKWPTLSKMTMNLINKISPAKLITNGLYNFEKLKAFNLMIQNDLEAIKNFTSSSMLDAALKNSILKRIENISEEIDTLNNLITARVKFIDNCRKFSNDYSKWTSSIGPTMKDKKRSFEKVGEEFTYFMLAAATCSVILLFIGFVVYGYYKNYAQGKINFQVVDITKNKILSNNQLSEQELKNGWGKFNSEIQELSNYVNVRLSLGKTFQEGIVLPTAILNKEYKIIWSNPEFLHAFKLENLDESEKNNLTWNLLKKINSSVLFENLDLGLAKSFLGHVVENECFLSSDLDFRIWMKPDEKNEKIVMTMYNLKNDKTELSIIKEDLLHPFKIMMEKDISMLSSSDEIRNIEPIDSDELYYWKERAQELSYSSELNQYLHLRTLIQDNLDLKNKWFERFEGSSSELTAIQEMFRTYAASTLISQKESMEKYQSLKSYLLKLFELQESINAKLNENTAVFNDMNKIKLDEINYIKDANGVLKKYSESLKPIINCKIPIRTIRSDIESNRVELTQSLDQLNMFFNFADESDSSAAATSNSNYTSAYSSSDAKYNQRLMMQISKLKFEMKAMEKTLFNFLEITKELDVSISKVELMKETEETVDLNALTSVYSSLQIKIEELFAQSKALLSDARNQDETLLDSLKFLVNNLKNDLKRTDALNKEIKRKAFSENLKEKEKESETSLVV